LAKPHGWALVISFYSWAGMIGILWWIAQRVGWSVVVLYYGAPLFVFASWLVVVTFLHHNDETTPWYSESTWTQVKGALSSVDRDYGFVVNMLSNNIHLHQIHSALPLTRSNGRFSKSLSTFDKASHRV
jgi:omega-3 fatty acid desaturase (delta-15 desaturase)